MRFEPSSLAAPLSPSTVRQGKLHSGVGSGHTVPSPAAPHHLTVPAPLPPSSPPPFLGWQDEFDVFMDAVNRRVAMQNLFSFARDNPELQFIFLSPQVCVLCLVCCSLRWGRSRGAAREGARTGCRRRVVRAPPWPRLRRRPPAWRCACHACQACPLWAAGAAGHGGCGGRAPGVPAVWNAGARGLRARGADEAAAGKRCGGVMRLLAALAAGRVLAGVAATHGSSPLCSGSACGSCLLPAPPLLRIPAKQPAA